MSKRVVLHVGTPKTGTSHLQDVLFRHRVLLQGHGLTYPADRFDAHFLAALDLLRMPWGGLEREAVGAWDRLAQQVRSWPGTAIVSHEILAAASPEQVERALASLGAPATEVHLVVSVRDLGRQIPAEWQETVKHRASLGYADFLARIRDPERATRVGAWFWSVQEVPDILQRWGATLPPEQVHVVTVPSPGAPDGELWRRFCQAFGLAGIALDPTAERVNPSLGVPETALLRRLNARATPVVDPVDYRPLVRELLAHRTLAGRSGSPRLALPPDAHAWVEGLAAEWTAVLEERGYSVLGSWEDLRAVSSSEAYADPDAPDEHAVGDAALDALTALVRETSRLRHREGELARELDETRGALERAYLRPSHRLREKAVGRLEGSRGGRAALAVYRRARGRA